MKTKIFATGVLTALLAVSVNAFAEDTQQGTATDQSQQMMQPQAPSNTTPGSQSGTTMQQQGQPQSGQGSSMTPGTTPPSTGNSGMQNQ